MNSTHQRSAFVMLGLFLLAAASAPSPLHAQEYTPPNYPPTPDMSDWLAATQHQNPIPPGTTIDNSNWQQYKEEMGYGLQTLFAGKGFWKIPPDAQIPVGPTVILNQPKPYLEASEKYGGQTTNGVTPAGHRYLKNYHGGIPFPTRFRRNRIRRKATSCSPMTIWLGFRTFTRSPSIIRV